MKRAAEQSSDSDDLLYGDTTKGQDMNVTEAIKMLKQLEAKGFGEADVIVTAEDDSVREGFADDKPLLVNSAVFFGGDDHVVSLLYGQE